jgi:hypothetical protein
MENYRDLKRKIKSIWPLDNSQYIFKDYHNLLHVSLSHGSRAFRGVREILMDFSRSVCGLSGMLGVCPLDFKSRLSSGFRGMY